MTKPDFLCIGFCCHDVHQEGYHLGGAASYCSLMIQQLGIQTAVLTSVGEDFKFLEVFQKNQIQVHQKRAAQTTVFDNHYHEDIRRQYLLSRADTLSERDLPEIWKSTPVVLFCPIANEVSYSLLQTFPKALKAATIQGWLRQWDDTGQVSSKDIDWFQLKALDIIFLSEEDIRNPDFVIPELIRHVKLIVLTKGERGATVYHKNKQMDFPAFPTKAVDTTGAGDIFAAAFLVAYYKTGDIIHATAYGHAAASLIVEEIGLKIPSIERIGQRYEAYRKTILK